MRESIYFFTVLVLVACGQASDPTAYQAPQVPASGEVRTFLSKVRIDSPTNLRPQFATAGWQDQYGCVQRVEVVKGGQSSEVIEFSHKQCPAVAGTVAAAADVDLRLVYQDTGKENASYDPVYSLSYNGAVVGQATDNLSLSTDLISIDGLCQIGAPTYSCKIVGSILPGDNQAKIALK